MPSPRMGIVVLLPKKETVRREVVIKIVDEKNPTTLKRHKAFRKSAEALKWFPLRQ